MLLYSTFIPFKAYFCSRLDSERYYFQSKIGSELYYFLSGLNSEWYYFTFELDSEWYYFISGYEEIVARAKEKARGCGLRGSKLCRERRKRMQWILKEEKKLGGEKEEGRGLQEIRRKDL